MYLLILAVVIAPVRLAGVMAAPGADISAQSAPAVTPHCEKTASMQIQEGQSAGATSAQEDCDCCDSICDCVNCAQDCYQLHIVCLIGLTGRDSGYQPPVLHAHMETTIHGITFPPFEPPPIR